MTVIFTLYFNPVLVTEFGVLRIIHEYNVSKVVFKCWLTQKSHIQMIRELLETHVSKHG